MRQLSWRSFLPRSLAGQLIGLLLIAVVLSQAVSIWMFHDERRVALIEVARDNILMRSVSIAKLIEDTPDALHSRILDASSSQFAAFWIGETPAVDAPGTSRSELRLQAFMAESFAPTREVRLELFDPRHRDRDGADRKDWLRPSWKKLPKDERPDRLRRIMSRQVDLVVSIPVSDAAWLNVATSYRPPKRTILPLLVQLATMAALIVLIVGLAVRRAARPLQHLASAADRLGRGEDMPPLDVRGPSEVRAVTQAFNDMQDRLTRFVRDRTRMLAAISHDLRTPITSLRLRAEFIDDDENREKIIETLDEMSQMTEATLSFARDEAAREEARPTDLGGLLESIAGDQQDLGHDARVISEERIVLTCRSLSLKRALRNLIENGIRYGGGAEITLSRDEKHAVIVIADRGPGIPDDRLADVFEPFVRLEESRSEETGGIGLGLAISRSIIHAHGGTIDLSNRPSGGLEACVKLPLGN